MLGADNLGAQLITVHTKKVLDFLNVIHNEANIMDC